MYTREMINVVLEHLGVLQVSTFFYSLIDFLFFF